MSKKIMWALSIGICLLLMCSCHGSRVNNELGGTIMSEGQKADMRIDQIISAIIANDKESLKSLFSKKALSEADHFDDEVTALFDFIQGDITSWEKDSWSSSESIEYGKRSLMIRSAFKIVTDVEEYDLFLIDYVIDTIDLENEGVYMLEVSKLSYSGEWESWQNRMRAGISIVE